MNKLKIKKIERNEITPEAKSNLKQRTIIALILIAILVPCMVLGGWFYLALVIVSVGVATYEVAKAPSRKLSWFVWIVTFITMYSLIFWVMLKYNMKDEFKSFSIYTSFTDVWLSPLAIAIMIGLYFFVVVIKPEFLVSDACYLIAMTLVLSIGFQSLLFVRYIPFKLFPTEVWGLDITTPMFKYAQSMFLLMYLLIAICFNDIGGYLFGMLFGKHKMNPRISPKKTWEGFVGGIFMSVVLSIGFSLTVAALGYPMLPKFTIDKWYWTVLVSLILPFVGNLGDFAFSSIKRHFNKKDYSKLLGPHGGVLDRIDSAIFGAIALMILVILITNKWNLYL